MLVFGATSLVGSHFVSHSPRPVAAAGRNDPSRRGLKVSRFDRIDLAHPDEVAKLVESAPEPVIVNFAARTDVDGVESERRENSLPEGPAWTVNALVPGAISLAAKASGKRFLQISTDFVFDGAAGPYDESAARSPLSAALSWYGWTKSEGERLATNQNAELAIVRISYPYRLEAGPKLDFARWILEKHRANALPPLYGNQQITPTWIPDVTQVVETLIRRPLRGVFHVASPEVTSPLEFGRVLLSRVEGKVPMLTEGELRLPRPGSGVAPRPIRGGLISRRTTELGMSLTSWRKGIDHWPSKGQGVR